MNSILLYTRYTDKKNRLFIVIERFGSIDKEAVIITPSVIKLLDVNEQKATMLDTNTFNDYLKKGQLKQL